MKNIHRFNDWLAIKITNGVSTMWCAYAFTIIAFISLPEAIKGGIATLIAWIAQTFLQLVLLSVIMVGQKIQNDQRQTILDSHDEIHEKLDGIIDNIGKNVTDIVS